MRTITLTSSSMAELLRVIEEQPGAYRHLFRGQSDASWGLVPALYRITSLNIAGGTLEENYSTYEQTALELFFREAMPYLPPLSRGYSVDRIVAQHFGVPTRLLDWTRDPLVAAFFATEDPRSNVDAAIFMILPDAHYMPEHVRSLGPHQAISFEPPAIDRRIPAQKSIFTFHPYGDPGQPFVPLDQRANIGNQITTAEGVERGFAKIVIPARLTRAIHGTLLGLGIDRRNLFPGLDGVGADVAARARQGKIW